MKAEAAVGDSQRRRGAEKMWVVGCEFVEADAEQGKSTRYEGSGRERERERRECLKGRRLERRGSFLSLELH